MGKVYIAYNITPFPYPRLIIRKTDSRLKVIGLGCLAVHLGLLQMHVATALQQMSGVLVGLSLIAIGLLGFKDSRFVKVKKTILLRM